MIWPDDFINQVICGDALELLPMIPDNAVDLIITDPVWPGASVDLPGSDRPVEILTRAGQEFPRITQRVIIHYGQMTDPRTLLAIPSSLPFVQLCWLEWVPAMYRGPVMVGADIAYVFGHKKLPGDGTRVFGGKCQSAWNRSKQNEARLDPENNHPCPRSIDHVAFLVRRFSRPGQLILDPFCGSGTTLLAAKLAGRDYCGIDIKLKFVEYAHQRLAAPDLFNQVEAG